jgi:pSer/pThr/pTyr-binding forkhead associated (FHA) protein
VAEPETARLVVRKGSRVGRKFKLAASPVEIGSDRRCQVVVTGEYVDPVHAVLNRRGDLWYVENKSVNGTLVNQLPITSKILEPGDMIQIGSSTLLAFELLAKTEKKPRAKKAGERKDRGLFGNPVVVGGLGIYLAVLVIGFVYFGMRGSGSEHGFSAEYARQIVGETRAFLASDALLFEDSGAKSIDLGALDDASEPAADYYRLVAARRAGASSGDLKQRIDVIGDRIGEQFAQAWLLEQQERWSEAMERYRRITAIVPDGRAPSTQAAASRIEELRAKLHQ